MRESALKILFGLIILFLKLLLESQKVAEKMGAGGGGAAGWGAVQNLQL